MIGVSMAPEGTWSFGGGFSTGAPSKSTNVASMAVDNDELLIDEQVSRQLIIDQFP